MEAILSRSPVVEEEKQQGGGCVGGEKVVGDTAGEQVLESRSARHGGQRSDSSSPDGKYSNNSRQGLGASVGERSPSHTTSVPRSSSPEDTIGPNQGDRLQSTRAEMSEVKRENERLKTTLARIMKDYQSLQMQFFDTIQRGHDRQLEMVNPNTHQETDESDLVSLSLGTSSSGQKRKDRTATGTKGNREDEQMKEVLSLGLDCKSDTSRSVPTDTQTNASPESSFEEAKEEEAGEPWRPSKTQKTLGREDGDITEQTPVKRARVSVRVRCDAPTMNDGCQWRKYGQKVAKGNPCPRAYYRCTVAPACPVRKQVQRCAEDMSILITTYEGTHNHPLPISATAMASTTSAAASMLMSGSSASRPATGAMGMASSTVDYATAGNTASLHGLNFGLSDISSQRQFYPQNPSIISSSPACPTITLDLTAPSSSSPSTQFGRFSSSFPSTTSHSQTSLAFPTSQHFNTPPISWGSGYLKYANQPYNNRSQICFSSLGRTPQEPFYSSFLQKATNPAPLAGAQPSMTDTAIAAATKAITSDPSFQSALVAAITSVVGGNGNQGAAEALRRNLRMSEEQVLPVSVPFTPSSNGNGCASSYLTRSTSSGSNPQNGNLMFLQPSLAFPSSKSASASPVETGEHINS